MATDTPVVRAAPAEDWLTAVNRFRAEAGLGPVVADDAASVGATNHSCYMLINGITHVETPGAPGYTPSGATAGSRSNVAVTGAVDTTDRRYIEMWMTAPYHALGILRPGVTSMGYGVCRDANSPRWRSGATLDIMTGLRKQPLSMPVMWPGNGTRTNLDRFGTEDPSPVTECGWTGAAGTPILALLPEVPTGANALLVGPNGPVQTCVLTAANSTNSTAKAILEGDNGVIVLPRVPLAAGEYSVTLTTAARTVDWTFTIDPSAADWSTTAPLVTTNTDGPPIALTGTSSEITPLPPQRLVDTRSGLGAGRLAAGQTVALAIGGVGPVPAAATAVSLNITAVGPAAAGYLSAFPCGAAPSVSTVNFAAGADTPNAALVPLDSAGRLCVMSSADTDLLIDVNGALLAGAGGQLQAVTPSRIVDTRQALRSTGRLDAGWSLAVPVIGGGSPVPAGASMVAMNVTAVDPAASGYVTIYPCGAATPVVSSLNPRAGETRPNFVLAPIAADGTVCFTTSAPLDLVVDVTGYVLSSGAKFMAAQPTRIADTRTGARVAANGTLRVPIAGRRGLPVNTRAVAVNITATATKGSGHVTAYPCDAPMPVTSTLNRQTGRDVANAAQLQLGADGSLCLFSTVSTDLIVDLNGIWL